jgi:hypothetical protein
MGAGHDQQPPAASFESAFDVGAETLAYTQKFTFGSASPHNVRQSVSTSAWRAWAVP